MAPPAMSSPRRTTAGSSRIAICNASLMACWYVIVRVAVSATMRSSLAGQRVVSKSQSISDVDVGESLFRLREGGSLRRNPGIVELLRHARVDHVEFVCPGYASIDDRHA